MDIVLQDLRYALRTLRRQPAFAVLAISTLALGIGANAAIFSVVNAVLLRPLPYHRPDRIVALTTQWQKTGRRGTVSGPDFQDWHDGTSSFAAMAAYADDETSVNVGGTADYGTVTAVGPEFFDVFGVEPALGRPLGRRQPNDDGASIAPASVWTCGNRSVATHDVPLKLSVKSLSSTSSARKYCPCSPSLSPR